MPAYVVTRRDPQRVAGAVIRYQLMQPRFLITVTAVLVGLALVGGTYRGGGGALLAIVFFAVLIVLVTAYKRGQLVKTLAARGYRPGATLDARADEDALTVTASTGSGRHLWADVEHARVINGVVLFRMRAARFVVAVPVGALPDGTVDRLTGKGAATRR